MSAPLTRPAGLDSDQTSPYIQINDQAHSKHDTPFDSPFELNFDDHFEDFNNAKHLAMTGGTSPFIKSEPNDFIFGGGNNNNNDDFGISDSDLHGIDPSRLAGDYTNNNHGNMSSSYVLGQSGIGDDELADLAGSLDPDYPSTHLFNSNNAPGSMPMAMHQQNTNNQMFSHTPDGLPVQSPFINSDNFSYGQPFRPSSAHQGSQPVGMPGSVGGVNVMRSNFNNMDRRVSDALLAASPGATSAIRGLHIGESADYAQSSNIQRTMMQHRHSASLSNNNNWDVGGQSWGGESFAGTPSTAQNIPQNNTQSTLSPSIANFATSLPVKIEGGLSPAPFQTQEAKKRRRRECHNIVERRRRDNINERIHDLGNLVPQHRLEDEKVRKHLQTNNPLSPTFNSNSPPTISSSLPTGLARRSSGASAMALPSEDKDKGPNKGDILNSSVAWTRDVIWYMRMKMEQEEKLERLVVQLGGTWPFERSDDEIRMRSELSEVIARNGQNNNIRPYSRADGSGLRVPGFTNLAGDNLQPGEQSGNSLAAFTGGNNMPRGWQPDIMGGFKEEDEDFDDDIMM